jgi:AcrR family transcriptional regulator
MTRPSQNTDQKLIQAALELLPETGYSGLKMRAVAKRARVNLGMFHYYFRSKEEFLERVANEFYDNFYKNFTLEAASGGSSREKLWNAIAAIVAFGKKNRQLVLALAKDVLENEQQLVRLLEKLFPRHGIILIKLIRQCQKEGIIADIPLPMAITFLMGSIFGPIAIMTVLEKVKLKAPYEWLKTIGLPFMLSDNMMEQRMKLAFHALAPEGGWEKKNISEPKNINLKIDQILDKIQKDPEGMHEAITKLSRPRRKP